MEPDFAELQAILAGLPMHAIPRDRSCGADSLLCRGPRKLDVDMETCRRRVKANLNQAAREYYSHEQLQRLTVEFASLDLVCFVDHQEKRLFAAVRGTNVSLNPLTAPDDMTSNMHIMLGYDPPRAHGTVKEYLAVRRRFENYVPFACGHSLGGAVVLHLARAVEDSPKTAFARVDVFNTATSPLSFPPVVPEKTPLHVHLVKGDWASLPLQGSNSGLGCQVHVRPAKASVKDVHSLRHFLPKKADEEESSPTTSAASMSPTMRPFEEVPAPLARQRPVAAAWWALLSSCVPFAPRRELDERGGVRPP